VSHGWGKQYTKGWEVESHGRGKMGESPDPHIKGKSNPNTTLKIVRKSREDNKRRGKNPK